MGDTEQKDWWVVEVESSLRGAIGAEESPDGQDKASSGLIHKVPECLLRDETREFYHPQVLFLGPYHFIGKERPPTQMESIKSEVARYAHLKIADGQESHNQSKIEVGEKKVDEKKEQKKKNKGLIVKRESGLKGAVKIVEKCTEENMKKEGYVKKKRGLIAVMESFKEKEEDVKNSYARNFDVTGDVCAWMMTRDACFLIQVLERFGDIDDDEDHLQKGVLASIDSILSRKRCNPELTNIVKDVFKLENQLPFWTLTEIRPDVEDWFESALKNLSPIKVADEVNDRQYKTPKKSESHILQLLHDYIVDSQPQGISLDCFSAILGTCVCVCFSCFHLERLDYLSTPCNCMWVCIKWLLKVLVFGIILLVLSPVVCIMCIINAIGNHKSGIWWKIRKISKRVPTVQELKRVGVKFKKLKGRKKGISHIEFKSSTLYLPQFEVDNSSEVILRNLIAFEICSSEEEKAITRYAILMNDLINTSEDVAILRGEDIIINKLGSDEEIAQFWNSMVTSAEMPSFKPIDDAVLGINHYRKRWLKVLWAQFVMTHCSKPWLFLSLLAGVILLVLTIVQVVCLFESCQIK